MTRARRLTIFSRTEAKFRCQVSGVRSQVLLHRHEFVYRLFTAKVLTRVYYHPPTPLAFGIMGLWGHRAAKI